MSASFLTHRERERLDRYPADVRPEDLSAYFLLSPGDLVRVYTQRGDHNRLGFALQLCALRYLGFAPDDLTTAPDPVVRFLAGQIGVAPDALKLYGLRAQTRRAHFQEVQAYLGFRRATEEDLRLLTAWLVTAALEHDRPTLLFQLACERLHRDKIVRPGLTRLEKIVATAGSRAEQETFERLGPLLTEERRRQLDGLLIVDATRHLTPLVWLRQTAIANSAAQITAALAKLDFIRGHGTGDWDLSAIHPNRLKFLAQEGRRSGNQMLQRAPTHRRYPILVAFLYQSLIDVTDETIELYDRCLGEAYAKARRALKAYRLSISRSANQKVLFLRQLGALVLDEAIADDALRGVIYQRFSPERLGTIIKECDQIARPESDHYYDFLGNHYSYIRQFAPAFLAAFTFHAKSPDHPLLVAIAVLRDLNRDGQRPLPQDAPRAFIPTPWRPYVIDKDGALQRRYWELCLLYELRGALRAGDIWLTRSRQYASPDTYLIPVAAWPELRQETCRQIQAPSRGEDRLRQREAELGALLALVGACAGRGAAAAAPFFV
ncbi:MAG: DUF4158 domain-containing protein [Chloroflexi bacterium CFX6]|nr:DUF4158 domain-containing protein [Chloroflexi bacterium CFX6]